MSRCGIFALIVILLSLNFIGCKGGNEEESTTNVAVHIGKIERRTLHRYVTAYGTVVPEISNGKTSSSAVLLASPTGGILREVLCSEGQKVKKGEILFRLDKEVAQASLLKAEKNLESAQNEYERKKKLLESDAVSKKSLEEAEANVAAAQSELAMAHTALSAVEIRAPISGEMMKVFTSIGQNIDAGMILGEVVDLNNLAIEARVPLSDAEFLKTGEKAFLENGESPIGEVSVVGKDVEQGGTILLRISLYGDSKINLGQFLKFTIITEEKRDVLSVPQDAVVKLPDGGVFVMVVDGEKALPVPIKAGLKDKGMVEVEGKDLKEGMNVVTEDAYEITGETKVHIIKEGR